MKAKYDIEKTQKYIVQHRAVVHHSVLSEMKIFIATSLWYFPATELVFGNAHCNDEVKFIICFSLSTLELNPPVTTFVHPNSVT